MNETKKPTLSAMDVVTPPVRLSFPALFEPRPRAPGADRMTYQATLLIPPEVDLRIFTSAIKAAMLDKWGGKITQLPADKNPIKDCADKADLTGYEAGWHFINAHSGYKPQVVDRNRQEVIDTDAIYPGCWCRFHLRAFAYDHKVGGKGVSFSLEAVMFVRDDDRFDGRRKASDIFDPLEGDEAPGDMGDLFS